ncbi:MAG: hypothetical protein CM15mP65_16970 [Crocinitomicaceae bacterium]|nr:MAG: hypothetical protein CM15mP65_16970 [Crocinitomicaceae bacterium]
MTATGYKFSCVQIVDGARVAFNSDKLLPSVKEIGTPNGEPLASVLKIWS